MKLKRLIFSTTLVITLCAAISPVKAIATEPCEVEECAEALSDNIKVDTRLRELFFGDEKQAHEIYLVPGGSVFGIKMKQKYVTVTAKRCTPPKKYAQPLKARAEIR